MNKTERFELRMTKEQKDKLRTLAKKMNMSMGDLLCWLVEMTGGKNENN